MVEVIVKESQLIAAAEQGMDEFIGVVTDAVKTAIGGDLNATTMPLLNSDQITLLAYDILRSN